MRHYFVYAMLLAGVLTSCQHQEGLEAKKSQLKEYQNEMKELQRKIISLEQEIAEADPSFKAVNVNATLVTLSPVQPEMFRHFISVSGSVASDRNVTINAEVSAEVEQVKVTKGEQVRKGQLLIVQDADAIRRTIDELQTSLELAATRFERQSALWEQQIGSEMQYLEAKNAKESLEKRLASARTQLKSYRVEAPFAGTIDEVYTKEGEVTMPGTPMLRLVSLQDMYIVADVSETYLGEFEQGDSVTVKFPSLNKTVKSTIASVGQVINENNRTFEIRVNLPYGQEELLRPNLLAVLQIEDFQQPDAVVVPTSLIQSDNRGDYVFVAVKQDGQLVAQKKRVERGMTYNNQTMITAGLAPGDTLIRDGSREVADGAAIRTADQANNSRVSFNQ